VVLKLFENWGGLHCLGAIVDGWEFQIILETERKLGRKTKGSNVLEQAMRLLLKCSRMLKNK
jgi:hypothetical protein